MDATLQRRKGGKTIMLGDPVRGRLREAQPAVKKNTKAVRMVELPQKKAARASRRIWIAGGALALILAMAWWIFAPGPEEKAPLPTSAAGIAASGGATGENANSQWPAPGGSPDAVKTQEVPLGFIKEVRLQPTQPIKTDTLKAEVMAAPGAPTQLTYTYVWKVNDQVITRATGDSLNLLDFNFKKGDRIGVTVTPTDGGTAGFVVASPEVSVYGIAPSLDLEIKRPAGGSESSSYMQLVSVAPDSAQLTFSLEPPLVPGMTIDKSSGKISWTRPPDLKGSVAFGAAVDDNQAKVIKTFEITLK